MVQNFFAPIVNRTTIFESLQKLEEKLEITVS